MTGRGVARRGIPLDAGGGRGTGSRSFSSLQVTWRLVPMTNSGGGLEGEERDFSYNSKPHTQILKHVHPKIKLDLCLIPGTLLLDPAPLLVVTGCLLVPSLPLSLRFPSCCCCSWQLSLRRLLQNGLSHFPLWQDRITKGQKFKC